MIHIVYRTGEEDFVSPKFLDILLYFQQIQMFERIDGWVVVGVDPLRSSYPGPQSEAERRQHKPTSLPTPVNIDPRYWQGAGCS